MCDFALFRARSVAFLFVVAMAHAAQAGPKLDVEAAVKGRLKPVQQCFERELKRQPALAGRIVLELAVGEDGRARRVRAAPESPALAEVAACIERVAGSWKFPEAGDDTLVQIPLTFAPDEAAPVRQAVAQPPVLVPIRTGEYWRFVPEKLAKPARCLVVVHGSLEKPEEGQDKARALLERWRSFADRHGLVLVAPVFDDVHFGSVAGPGGGYRALFGRDVGADAFLDAILADVGAAYPGAGAQVLLHGHSAGGQFALRYAVRHPAGLAAVVASGAASFAFPDSRRAWPDGAGVFEGRLPWNGLDPDTLPKLRIAPDLATWTAAAQLPITVLLGADDTSPPPGAKGAADTRLSRAKAWVEATSAVGAKTPNPGRVQVRVVPGVGHGGPALEAEVAAALEAVIGGP